MHSRTGHAMALAGFSVMAPRIAAVIVTIAVFALCLIEAIGSYTHITGDGNEYLGYTYNLARWHGPNLIEVPARTRQEMAVKLARLDDPASARPLGKGRHVDELIRAADGRVISWHFWGYSAFSVPAYLALIRMGGEPALAFALTNFMFIVALMAYLVWGSRQSGGFRSLLACLFMLSGTSFYVWWTHPEVMTASLAALGLVAWLDRRLVLSCACLALASTQNPPVAVLIVLPFACSLTDLLRARRDGQRLMPALIPVFAIALTSLIVFVPALWYLWRIGVANPIVAAGSAKFGRENFAKGIDLFFDLNQGMVLLQVGAFIVLAVWLAKALITSRAATASTRQRLRQILTLLFLMAAMALMSASAQNWNPGITVISRYSYWLSAPVLVALCIALDDIGDAPIRKWLELALVFVAVSLVDTSGVHGKDSNYLAFTRPAKMAMELLPNWYFPHPEVFCERAQEAEDCTFDRAYVYARPDGRPVKVLVAQDHVLRECGAGARHAPVRRETYDGKLLLWFSGPVICPSGRALVGGALAQTQITGG